MDGDSKLRRQHGRGDFSCDRGMDRGTNALVLPCLRGGGVRSSPRGGVVLDPFAGTGRAVGVAARHGRRAIGFELSVEYSKAAQRLLRRLTD